ncbi:hypothetical protein [Novosphingobium album (ex Liu et al. 2023)]|uniref:Uncharacterized protein n=1 Tax=Novosphingobium album (ex Liu et al. 2023) TaxID=3031130 RepID=A0ABT5WS13_9SPHN|nr:hypothetical protein [Novosphingobium album (ex Liu et al. 2023)]MDE8652818.1 hypothetical protein [Novosphingobium album (ex Liu et al. 2023)]
MATAYHRLRPRSDIALQVEALLDRYPRLNEQELARLIDLMPYLPLLDQALITADDRLAAKLGDFLRDHRTRLRAPPGKRLALLLIGAVLAALGLSLILT